MDRKPMGVTLKAAILGATIAGFFTLLGTLLTIFVAIPKQEIPVPAPSVVTVVEEATEPQLTEKPSEVGFQLLQIDEVSLAEAPAYLKVLRQLTGLSLSEPRSVEVGNFALRQGAPDSFYFSMFTDEGKYDFYYGVVTKINGPYELIFYEGGYVGEGVEFQPFVVATKRFVLINYTSGSGHFLRSTYFQYDGLTKPKPLTLVEDLFFGSTFFTNGKLFVDGTNVRYLVELRGQALELRPETARFEPRVTSLEHVLRVDPDKDDLVFLFDGSRIEFANGYRERTAKDPIHLAKGSVVVLDGNNSVPGRSFRVLTDGRVEFNGNGGLFGQLTFLQSGECEVTIDDGYKMFYHVRFSIE